MALAAAFQRWLFRLRGPETAPILLVQRRVFVLPTRAGLIYAGVLGVMLVGAINYNLSLGYALVFLLGGLGVVTVLHTFRNLVHLQISPGRADPVFAGEPAQFGLLLLNPRAEGRYGLRLFLQPDNATETDVPAQTTTAIALPAASHQRGWLRPGRVTLETRYPLGLVRAWSYIEPDMRCLVYPAPEAAGPPLPFSGAGEYDGLRSGRGSDDFFGLRGHQPADPPHHVAWKAVARQAGSGPLLTKQFAGASAALRWLDWQDLPPALAVEARLSRLARWAIEAASLGLTFGLRLPEREIAPASGARHLHSALEALALYGMENS